MENDMKRTLLLAGLVSAGLLLAGSPARAITWTLVESSGVHLRWPNQFNAANGFEANGGLLGRIVAHTSESTLNACELAESHPCASNEPPAVLGDFDGGPEGPPNLPDLDTVECNRVTIACEGSPIPGVHSGHPGGNTPNETAIGTFSYFVTHRSTGDKSMAFISGTYVSNQGAYTCNACPPEGSGRDVNNATALTNPKIAASLTSASVSLWTTQFIDIFGGTGHNTITLESAGAGAISACGNGVQFETLSLDPCIDEPYPVPIKWDVTTYSVSVSQQATPLSSGRCDGPDCYVQQVIVPAAITQSGGAARNVQVRKASTVLPDESPFGMDNATLDVILFAYTTQRIDADGDLVEDRIDPCPTDPTDFCVQDLFGGGTCSAGQVFCPDVFGTLGCRDPFLCNARVDADQNCFVSASDMQRVVGESDGGLDGTETFGSGVPLGPFSP
jgi:hypothetical protein